MKHSQYVIVVRHGLTLSNLLLEQATDAYYYEITGADTNIALTSLGFIQVDDATSFLAQFLGALRVARIYCSEYLRTRQTAESAQRALPNHPPIIEDKRIAKRNYGLFWNITYAGVRALFPEEYLKFAKVGAYFYRPPEGENYPDLKKRVVSFRDDKIDSTNENICVSTHSAAALMFEQVLLGEMSNDELVSRYDSVGVPNATISIYKRVAGNTRICGIRLDPIGWFKRCFGMRHKTWEKVVTFTPRSALDRPVVSDESMPANNAERDFSGDREDRIA